MVWAILIILLFFIMRELVTWYWKINVAISLKREHNAIMDEILQELRIITEVIRFKNDPSEGTIEKEENTKESTILN